MPFNLLNDTKNAAVFWVDGGYGPGFGTEKESGMPYVEGEFGGRTSNNPMSRDEQLKASRMDYMLSEDYQKLREEVFNNNMNLLNRNKDLLNQNRAILDKCNQSDNQEKYKLIIKENNRFKMELDLLQKQLSRASEDSSEMSGLIYKYKSEMECTFYQISYMIFLF